MSYNLTDAEQKLLSAVIDEMKEIPDVNFDAVAQKVGIKYARNAKTSFRKVWNKIKGGSGDASGVDAGYDDDSDKNLSPKKPAAKKAPAKKAPVAKKGVGKGTAPKKAADGGPKSTRPTRKTKKHQEEEAVAADAEAESEDHDDENEEETGDVDENGKFTAPEPASIEPFLSTSPVESIAPSTGIPACTFAEYLASAEVETGQELNHSLPPMDDEYEAMIREMPLEAWLKWKAESGYLD